MTKYKNIVYTKKFDKDIKLAIKHGYNLQKLKDVIGLLQEGISLPEKYFDHSLGGNYKSDIEFIRKLCCFPAVGSDIEFTSPDLYNALHGANITEAKFDEQGNLNIKIEDLYNFNKGRTSFRGRIGEKLQSLVSLEPYCIVVDVKIPKFELDKY